MHGFAWFCLLGAALFAPLVTRGDAPLGASLSVTQLDADVIQHATFQSHNQKVVADGSRIYTTHIRSRNGPYTAQTWRLSVSDDGGCHFRTMVEETLGTNPPVLECGADGTLYVFRVDFTSGDGFLDRWPAAAPRDSAARTTTVIPGAAAGKYAALLDEQRHRLYFASHNGTFHRLRDDGTLLDSRTILRAGANGILQYPHLTGDEEGRVHLAWTTLKHGEYLYRAIHHLVSTDGGDTFGTFAGDRLELPIVADDTGPATRITPDDEFDVHTWLSSAVARAGRWHALYLAQSRPPRQHLVTYDIATGRQLADRQPELRGDAIRLEGLDGVFVADRRRPRRLYVIGNDAGRLGCLVSDDAGATWRDHARSGTVWSLYSIGGCRWTTVEGDCIGTFTDHVAPAGDAHAGSRVFFFRIPGAP